MGLPDDKHEITIYPLKVYCFPSLKKARKYVKKHPEELYNIDIPYRPSYAAAYRYDIDGQLISVIVFNEISKNRSNLDKLSTLVHECSHVVDFWLDYLDIEKVDTELRSMLVQDTFKSCVKQLGNYIKL